MIDTNEAFWLVWNPTRMPPMHKHESEMSAVIEARRLARTQPGETFIILRATEAITVSDIQQVKLHDPIPF